MDVSSKSGRADRQTADTIPRKRRLLYISFVYLFFLAILLAIEGGTRLTLPKISSLDLFVTTTQQRAQVADANQSSIFEGDSLLLWRLKPNLRNAIWDFTVISTNAEGFRSDYPVTAKQTNTLRIVCLGDSVTFGYRVPPVWPEKPTEFNPEWLPYPMLLEKHLRAANQNRKIEVITMAVPGYSSHQGLVWLRRDIDFLQPDILIASFGWNDVSFSDASDRETISTAWHRRWVRWLIDHSQAFAHATRWLRSRQKPSLENIAKPQPRVSLEEYVDNMSQIVSLAKSRNAKAIVIGAPYRDRVTNVREAELMMQYRSSLGSQIERADVPFLQIRELTEEAYPSNEGWFGELIHPNHMGHRLMTLHLLKLFKEKSLTPELQIPEFTP
jgi:lysophospholipase L1-like esterase